MSAKALRQGGSWCIGGRVRGRVRSKTRERKTADDLKQGPRNPRAADQYRSVAC